jgi:hypothetical protein
MQSRLRAAIAATIIAHASRRQVASLYDHEAQQHLELHAQATGAQVTCYDLSDGTGLSGELPDLVRSPAGARIHLAETGSGEYRGFDYGGESHFEVRPNGLTAALYDHDAQSWFAYTARSAAF